MKIKDCDEAREKFHNDLLEKCKEHFKGLITQNYEYIWGREGNDNAERIAAEMREKQNDFPSVDFYNS